MAVRHVRPTSVYLCENRALFFPQSFPLLFFTTSIFLSQVSGGMCRVLSTTGRVLKRFPTGCPTSNDLCPQIFQYRI